MPRLWRPSWREIINASRIRLFLSDFNQTWTLAVFSKKKKKKPYIKFYENPSGGSRVVPCGQLEMQAADMTKPVVALHFVANDPAACCSLQYKCKIWCFGVLKIHLLFWSSVFILEMAPYVSPKCQLTHYMLLQPRTRQFGFGLPRQVFPVQYLILCIPNWNCSSLINVYMLIKVNVNQSRYRPGLAQRVPGS